MDTTANLHDFKLDSLQDRIAKLLGQGIEAHRVASVLGCEPSYISNLLADDTFSQYVQNLKLQNLQEATARDKRYDKLEDALLDKIEHDVEHNPLAFKSTSEKVRNLQAINGLKRRGANADSLAGTQVTQNIVQIMLPTMLASKFIKNANNEIVQAGNKNLLTMQSNSLQSLANNLLEEPSHEHTTHHNKKSVLFYE